MASLSKVCFFFERSNFSLGSRRRLKSFIESIFKREGKELGVLNFIFCSDNKLLAINRQFLHHNFYTDIITFDLSESEQIQAEVYISIDRVRENAKNMGVSFKSEIHRVIFHGVLHLCGYKDKTKEEKKKMSNKEYLFLNQYIMQRST
ncbi:MAG: rRNA maturation RNase YbeY [Bacteroidetes bacterium]|nr:rRNA maturation RNase YbeY [Bacteroidota bacterium]